jgi:hypothetical protein
LEHADASMSAVAVSDDTEFGWCMRSKLGILDLESRTDSQVQWNESKHPRSIGWSGTEKEID